MWLRACGFDIVLYPQPCEKTRKDGKEYFWWDKELEVFLLEGFKSDVLEYLVSLLQVENAQNMYPNFSFTIIQVSIR